VFFECGQFRSIGDHAQVVLLEIGVGKVFHRGGSGRGGPNHLTFLRPAKLPELIEIGGNCPFRLQKSIRGV
jgi:hypothetical protein